ncbi:MAG: twin-arginine translocase TatA/TatE family subunit [Solirubrobacterales bacterium]|nr:twin-arginine translocase TatA/TatE family subunit [Solirubrobacterales bacterium]
MGIGVLEVLILLVIVVIVFGGYKRLPSLGRSAGTGVRKGGEKAKQIAGQVQERAEGVDTKKISQSVGKGIREAREVRDAVKGVATDDSSTGSNAAEGQPEPPAPKEPAAPEKQPADRSAES